MVDDIEVRLPELLESASPEAIFRLHVLSFVIGCEALGMSRAQAVKVASRKRFLLANGKQRTTSIRTLYRWLETYSQDGAKGLEPSRRGPTTTSAVLDDKLVEFFRGQREQDCYASTPELIRRAVEHGLIPTPDAVDRTTVWRLLSRLGLPPKRSTAKAAEVTRRFSFVNRMQMMLVDGKHFRAGQARLRRVAMVYLDDCTRKALAGIVAPSECSAVMLKGLYLVLRDFGLMDAVFLDRGPGFIANDTKVVCEERLGIPFILGTAHYPQAHGKIERLNQTMQNDILRVLAKPDVDPSEGALTLRLQHYLFTQYNERPHEALQGLSPNEAWNKDERALRFVDDDEALRERFIIKTSKRVSPDNVVKVGGCNYEVPVGYAGQMREIRRGLLTGKITMIHDGEVVELHPVDLHANATTQRSGKPRRDKQETMPSVLTAAELAFKRAHGGIIGPDGGLVKKPVGSR